MRGSVYLKRSQLQPICHAEIRRRKRRLSHNRLSLWQDLGEAARDGRKAGGWQRWLDGWMRQARDFKEMTWEQVQRKKARVSSLFVSNCTCRGMHEGEKSVLQDGDNRLRSADRPHPLPPPTPYLYIDPYIHTLSWFFLFIYLAQFLWEQPARGALKSEGRRKQSQVCSRDMMGPEVGLRGEGQTLECVTKG